MHGIPICAWDHGPYLITRLRYQPFEKQNFKFQKLWLTHPQCSEVIANAWTEAGLGSVAYVLKKQNCSILPVLV